MTRITLLFAIVVLSMLGAGPLWAQTPTLALEEIQVLPGQVGAPLSLTLTNPDPVDALQIGIVYDPFTMEATEVSLANGVLAGLTLEFSDIDIDAAVGNVTMMLILDSSPPFDLQIAPGTDQLIADLILDIETALFPGTQYPVQFADGVGDPPVTNQVFVEGVATTPDLVDGLVSISNENFIIINDSTTTPGTLDHEVEVSALNSENVQGFSLVVSFDNTLVNCTDVSLIDTITEAVGAEFVDPIFNNSEGFVILGVLLDALPPFEGQTIPAVGIEMMISKFIFEILPAASEVDEVPLTFVDGLGTPPISNIFVIGNQSITPQFVNGVIEILPDPVFLRGDANIDGDVDIADPVYTLCFVAGHFDEVPCELALDANDDELVGLEDAVYALNFLFLQGPPIPPPYPEPGTDPTPGDPPLPCDL